MFGKSFCFLFIFCNINSYSNYELLDTVLEKGCMESNSTEINDRLSDCRKLKPVLPYANIEKLLETSCSHIKIDYDCFKDSFEKDIENCIKKGQEKHFNLKIKVFNAGFNFKCVNKKNIFKEFLKPDGKNCVERNQAALNECSTIITLSEPWEDLSSIRFHNLRYPYSNRECRQKALWVYCALAHLNNCKTKAAANYYKGFYGFMLAASPCKKLIEKEYPLVSLSAVSYSPQHYLSHHILSSLLFIISILI